MGRQAYFRLGIALSCVLFASLGDAQSIVQPLDRFGGSPTQSPVRATSYAEESLATSGVQGASADCGCNQGCSSCCDCNSGCGWFDCCPLFSCISPSDHCFDEFISPMTNPVYFEDPRSLTEVRPIFANHRVPQSAGGGTIQVYAAQIRLALNECVSIIATKDGYIVSDHPLIHDGWADVSAGLKFNLYRDVEEQQLLAGGVVYEIPAGSHSAFQGNGDGEFHLFLTGGTELGTDWHLISGTGLRLAVDPTLQSNSWYWSNHLDRKLTDCLYALTELNWYHWFHSGNNPTTGVPGIEGGDFFNLGSPNVTGNNIVTMAWGGKYKPNENFELGVAYEVPLTKRKDVMEDRLTVDMIFRY